MFFQSPCSDLCYSLVPVRLYLFKENKPHNTIYYLRIGISGQRDFPHLTNLCRAHGIKTQNWKITPSHLSHCRRGLGFLYCVINLAFICQCLITNEIFFSSSDVGSYSILQLEEWRQEHRVAL